MSWLEILGDARPIKSIFGETVPTLQVVDLHEITLGRDGPTIVYRFDIIEYPDTPPRKWTIAKYNKVQLSLTLFDVKKVSLSGLARRMEIKIDLKRSESGDVIFHATGSGIDHKISSSFADVLSISAYQDSREK